MNFLQYKSLAKNVFPELSETFDSMVDGMEIHVFLISHINKDIDQYKNWDDFKRADLYSLLHMAKTQVRHLTDYGRTYWDSGKK